MYVVNTICLAKYNINWTEGNTVDGNQRADATCDMYCETSNLNTATHFC